MGCFPQALSESDYLSRVSAIPSFSGASDEELLMRGQQVCDYYDSADVGNEDELLTAARSYLATVDPEDVDDTAALMGLAVRTFCVEYTW